MGIVAVVVAVYAVLDIVQRGGVKQLQFNDLLCFLDKMHTRAKKEI